MVYEVYTLSYGYETVDDETLKLLEEAGEVVEIISVKNV